MVQLLLEHFADPNIQDHSGQTVVSKVIKSDTLPIETKVALLHAISSSKVVLNDQDRSLLSSFLANNPLVSNPVLFQSMNCY